MGKIDKNKAERTVSEHTDDFIAVIIVFGYIFSRILGYKEAIPIWMVSSVISYVFGKNLPKHVGAKN